MAIINEAITPAAPDCPCIDSRRLLSSQPSCVREDGSPGVWTPVPHSTGNDDKNSTGAAKGACYPVSYGAEACAAHDLHVDPRCDSSNNNPPKYCQQSFCYIDNKACKLSTESFYRSDFFGDLWYSYSTCNSTADNWLNIASTQPLDDLTLSVAVPAVNFPKHFKTTADGGVADFLGQEYYDDTAPWKGWQLEYLNAVAEISNIDKLAYTSVSKGSNAKASSPWTAAVHDVQAGISCLAISNFWITADRLKLTMFTTPVALDKVYLYIKSPAVTGGATFAENVQKTLAPFETNLWYLILGLLVFLAALTVFFANERGEFAEYWEEMRSPEWKKASYFHRTRIFLKMWLESFLLKSTYAMTQSAGMNTHNSFAQKLINVGFAFLGLILVSAYTANLAAFLTVSLAEQIGYIKDMKDAVAKEVTICGYGALRDDLTRDWPTADILYLSKFEERVEAFDAGKCSAILYSESDLLASDTRMSAFCERKMVMTGPPVLELPIGFPVCSELGAGISHWIYEAEKRGITYGHYEEQNRPVQQCSFDLPEDQGDGDMARLAIEDFALPLTALAVCIVLASSCESCVENQPQEQAVEATRNELG